MAATKTLLEIDVVDDTTTDYPITKTEMRYLDGVDYIRVFFGGWCGWFEDVPEEEFEAWKEATGNYETGHTLGD